MAKQLDINGNSQRFPEVNIRRAMAGLYLLQGRGSLQRCLIDAGYSRATARNPTDRGIDAKTCLEEAGKLDAAAVPANLLETARKRALMTMQSVDPSKVRLSDAMKMLDVTEKYYGGHEVQHSPTLALAERLAGIAALLAVARERGITLPVASKGSVTIEAESVNSLTADIKGLAVPASDNSQYVNSEADVPDDEETAR